MQKESAVCWVWSAAYKENEQNRSIRKTEIQDAIRIQLSYGMRYLDGSVSLVLQNFSIITKN